MQLKKILFRCLVFLLSFVVQSDSLPFLFLSLCLPSFPPVLHLLLPSFSFAKLMLCLALPHEDNKKSVWLPGNEALQCDLHEITSLAGLAALPRRIKRTLNKTPDEQPFLSHSSRFSGRFVSCCIRFWQVKHGKTEWKRLNNKLVEGKDGCKRFHVCL